MKHRGAPRCQLLVSSPARGATARQLLVSSALLSTTAPLRNVFPSGRLYNRPNNRPSPHSISAGRLYQCEFKRGRERYKPLLYSHCHNRPAEIDGGEGRLLGRLYNRPDGNTLWRGAVVLSSAEDKVESLSLPCVSYRASSSPGVPGPLSLVFHRGLPPPRASPAPSPLCFIEGFLLPGRPRPPLPCVS